MRYATKTTEIEGKSYNVGDIIPDSVKDVAALKRYSRSTTKKASKVLNQKKQTNAAGKKKNKEATGSADKTD